MSMERFSADDLLSEVMEHVKVSPNVAASLGSIVEFAKKAFRQWGCEHKDDIVSVTDKAIDTAVAFNIPQLPDFIEIPLDRVLSSWAKKTIKDFLDEQCPIG